jgi:hypothetical protein
MKEKEQLNAKIPVNVMVKEVVLVLDSVKALQDQ